ncbi:hypothetical protein HYS95_02210 [Candidatus Daviesbacteria bacterium]|nr:hypothetical protein [Candidatus Daviesbacteria bacterium]
MSEIKIGPIATEWYRPCIEGRSFTTNFQLGRTIIAHYGENAVDLSRKLAAAGSTLSRRDTEQVDKFFLRASKEIYRLPSDLTHPRSFYKECKESAIAAVQYFGQLVPELAEDFEMRGEIAKISDRPSDLLRYLASPVSENEDPLKKGAIFPTLAYEAQRHAILHYQIGIIESRALNAGLSNLLADVQDLLNERLFAGVTGKGDPIPLESYHDDQTNRVVGFPDRSSERLLTAHLKRQRITVRNVPEVGYVHKKDREKELGPTIVKTWVKALRNGGVVHIDEALQDSIGMRFVLMDDAVPPEQFADLVISVIKAGIESRLDSNHPRALPRIDKVVDDPDTNTDHGQSTEINFNARKKIWFEGISTPMELIFYDRATFLNSEMEVGTQDSKTGLFMGRAHKLFELRRAREVIRVPFPKEVYPLDDYVLNKAFVNQSKQLAFSRLNMHKAA